MKPMMLRDVTLLGIDGLDVDRLAFAIEVSQRHIEFGAVKILTHLPSTRADVVPIPPITTIEEYSRFVIKELHRYVTTTHVLIVQWDGFVLNPSGWTDRFLQYDYVGAPWHDRYGGGVGNGGFSLRSKRLLDHLAQDPNIEGGHPEDFVICGLFGNYLQARGFEFAPLDVARDFSVEATRWERQFGFHVADISDWPIQQFADEQRHAHHIAKFRRLFRCAPRAAEPRG